jgi:hypothetical protein
LRELASLAVGGDAQVLNLPAAAAAIELAGDDQPQGSVVLEGHQHLGGLALVAPQKSEQLLGHLQEQCPLQLGLEGNKGRVAEQGEMPGRQGFELEGVLRTGLAAGRVVWTPVGI